jgi:hypothetical protein
MANKGGAGKRGGAQPPRWKGGEVEDSPGVEAERAADRAEGNSVVRADEEAERLHALAAEPELGHAAGRRDRPTDDEEIEDLAEERRARRAAGEPTPHGRI